MNVLFLHRGFPSQFKFPVIALTRAPQNLIMFITNDNTTQMSNVQKIRYEVSQKISPDTNFYLREYEDNILHGQAAAEIALAMKKQGIKPDIIIGHAWGPTLFIKEIFPDVPFIGYFEWYCKYENSIADFGEKQLNLAQKVSIKMENSNKLQELCACDFGISPTQWQKSQFPKEFQDKIEVIHDGIDTNVCKPSTDAKFIIPEKNLEFSAKDEIITYATRGMEPNRGFPQFMEAVDKLLKKRPNAQFIIAGSDETYYSNNPEHKSCKKLMLEKFDIDLNRVHFVGLLPYQELLKLMQISSAHVYLTYPLFLSWSFLEAMSTGCCIVASNTPPVAEVMKDNYNGLLVDFFNVDELVEKIEYALDNKDKMQRIRDNARKTIIENYSVEKTLLKYEKLINKIALKS